jgi:hypothetical protein
MMAESKLNPDTPIETGDGRVYTMTKNKEPSMCDKTGRSEWAKWIIAVVGWFVGVMLATLPQMLAYSARFAVVETKADRSILDIKELQTKGSDPVQTLSMAVALDKQSLNEFRDRLTRFERNQEAMMNDQTKILSKLEIHLAETKKPISMAN